jgi:DNA-directed RNA polymerase subunit beta'
MAFHGARKVKEEMDESERARLRKQEAEELASAQLAALDAETAVAPVAGGDLGGRLI